MSAVPAADRAATWYAEGRGPATEPNVRGRPKGPRPRALEARGFGNVHHILVQIADVGLRPRFAEACKAFGDIVWCDELDELVPHAAARQALAVVVDVADRWGTSTAKAIAAIRQDRPSMPIVLWCDRAAASSGALGSLVGAGVSSIVFRDET